MANGISKENQFQALLVFYNQTHAEITRYRDREWKNLGIFTAEIGAIVGYILSNKSDAQSYQWIFDMMLVALVAGNIYYTWFAHKQLTLQRNIQRQLEFYFQFYALRIAEKRLIPFGTGKSVKDFNVGFTRGFWSHLVPFYLASVLLAAFGIWNLHH